MKIFCVNRKANALYTIVETFEAGIVLTGYEVKSIVNNNVNIGDAFAIAKGQELYVINMNIAQYSHANNVKVDQLRTRKLLLHKWQIQQIQFKAKKDRLAIIVLKVYAIKNKIKLEIALAKSKKIYDRREDIKKRDLQREMQRKYKYK